MMKRIYLGILVAAIVFFNSCKDEIENNQISGGNKKTLVAEEILTPAQKELINKGSLIITHIELKDNQNRKYTGYYDKEKEELRIRMVERQMSATRRNGEVDDPQRIAKLDSAGISLLSFDNINIESMPKISNNFNDSVTAHYGQTGTVDVPGDTLLLNYKNEKTEKFYTWNIEKTRLDGPYDNAPLSIRVYLANAENRLHTHGHGYSIDSMKKSYDNIKKAGGDRFTCQFTFYNLGDNVKNLMEAKDSNGKVVDVNHAPAYYNFGDKFP